MDKRRTEKKSSQQIFNPFITRQTLSAVLVLLLVLLGIIIVRKLQSRVSVVTARLSDSGWCWLEAC